MFRARVADKRDGLLVGVVRRDSAPQPVALGQGIPPGVAIDVVPVRLVNHTPYTVHYRDADLVLQASSAGPISPRLSPSAQRLLQEALILPRPREDPRRAT